MDHHTDTIKHHMFTRLRQLSILVLLVFPALVFASNYDKGLLWKIEKPGAVPSYIFGTIHLEDERVTALPEVVSKTLNQSRSFTMEILPSPQDDQTAAMAMVFTDGKNLKQVLGDSLFKEVASVAQKSGMTEAGIMAFKPWAMMMILSFPPPKTGIFLDKKLLEMARTQNKSLHALETMKEQLSIFNNASMDEQIHMLRETIKEHDSFTQEIEAMTKAYLARDLQTLLAISNDKIKPGDRVAEKFMKKLTVDRNHRMVNRMLPRLGDGNAFIAFGALHLPGNEGVLQLLENKGFKVSLLY